MNALAPRAVLEKLRPVVSCAVDHAHNLHAILDWPVENEVVADGQEAQSRREILPGLTGVRLPREKPEALLHRFEPAICRPHVE